jgi:hypothetical protein
MNIVKLLSASVITTLFFIFASAQEETLEQGRQYTEQFYSGELSPIVEKFSAVMDEHWTVKRGCKSSVSKFKTSSVQKSKC